MNTAAKHNLLVIVSLLSVGTIQPAAHSATITFDEFPEGTLVYDQYQTLGVVFGDEIGHSVQTYAYEWTSLQGGSRPMFVLPYSGRLTFYLNPSITGNIYSVTLKMYTEPSSVGVTAYDAAGNSVATTTVASDPAAVIMKTVTLTSSSNPIIRVHINSWYDNLAAIDDVSFSAAQPYRFSGFFSPIDNMPALNTVKAGSAIPVKFSIGGDKGLDIFAQGYPTSTKVACDASVPTDAIEETVTASNSNLSYDAANAQYVYVWKTDKSWSSSCRQLTVRLNDGTERKTMFQFTR